MKAEIQILSGARQGDRLELEGPLFLVGGQRDCQLYFDPDQDAVSEEQLVLFQFGDNGWRVKNVGSGTLLLNGEPLLDLALLHSGDKLKLSEQGPEFLVRFSYRPFAEMQANPMQENPMPDAPGFSPTTKRRSHSSSDGIVFSAIAGTIAGAAILAFAAWYFRRQAPIDARPIRPLDDRPTMRDVADQAVRSPTATNTRDAEFSATDSIPGPDRKIAASPHVEPWNAILDRLRDAVLLIVIEEPKTGTSWAFATACAIRGDTLLTSGTVGKELASFRERHWKLWAVNPRVGQKHELQNVRVHIGFDRSANQPEQQIYADFALLTLSDQISHVVKLATSDELDQLDRGQPLAMLGIAHNGEPLSRFATLAPELWEGSVFVVTSLPPSPGGPRLLHMRATLPTKPYGSPVVNEAGHVVGVFAETATAPADQAAALNLNYVPVSDLPALQSGLEMPDSEWWTAPNVPRAPPAAVAPFTTDAAKQHQQAWSQFLGKPVVETNSIGMELILLPPGEFEMGSTPEVVARLPSAKVEGFDDFLKMLEASELPQHHVKLTRPFRLSQHKTTIGQFRRFVDATNYKTEAETDGKGGVDLADWKYHPGVDWQHQLSTQLTEDMAVVNVTWNDAQVFCRWLSQQERKTYRLPTEAEWEFACRAGTATAWSFGDDDKEPGCYAMPNAFALFDMCGALWELCQDRFSNNYYTRSPTENPIGPLEDSLEPYVMRGVRSARRGLREPSNPSVNIGFRVVCEVNDTLPSEAERTN